MINGAVNTARLGRVFCVPLALPQTELRAGGALTIATFNIPQFWRAEIRILNIHLISISDPGAVVSYRTSSLGLVSAGVYASSMVTAPLCRAFSSLGVGSQNPFAPCVIETAGTYSVMAFNHTNNIDANICVTGAVKMYY